jgi:hypothetical protein
MLGAAAAASRSSPLAHDGGEGAQSLIDRLAVWKDIKDIGINDYYVRALRVTCSGYSAHGTREVILRAYRVSIPVATATISLLLHIFSVRVESPTSLRSVESALLSQRRTLPIVYDDSTSQATGIAAH